MESTSPTSPYTRSLHDALPISANNWLPPTLCTPTHESAMAETKKKPDAADKPKGPSDPILANRETVESIVVAVILALLLDRKSTRLNSSHPSISYAVFCLKKTM